MARGAAPTARRRARGRLHSACVLVAAALLAASLPCARAACNYTLSLPAASAGVPGVGQGGEGWCPPFVSSGGAAPTTCSGISVPPGAVLAFGTCALPGAVCSGATQLSLWSAASADQNAPPPTVLASVSRVALNSSVAALQLGCVLGVHCSYTEWQNPQLSPAPVYVAQGCYSNSACAGVDAWRIVATPAVLAPAAPSSAQALIFAVTPSTAGVTLTGLTAAVPTGTNVTIFARLNRNPFPVPGMVSVSSASRYTVLWAGLWPAGGGPVPLLASGSSVALPALNASAFVVVSAGAPLACASTLGSPGDPLFSDGFLSVSQGGALTNFSTAGATGTSCAWAGLSFTYTTAAACAPAPPAPAPALTIDRTIVLVLSLADMLAALANASVVSIVLDAPIDLAGAELVPALGADGTRTLIIEGGNACHRLSGSLPLCSIDAGGLSRVIRIGEGVSLTLAHLSLINGMAPAGGFGGCVLLNCSSCSLSVDTLYLQNCSAPNAGGGGMAIMGGGTLSAQALEASGCSAALGGAVMATNCTASLNGSYVHDSLAVGSAAALVPLAEALSDMPGVAGGGVALFGVTARVTACTFDSNAAMTTAVMLLSNPGFEQARGGGLFAFNSALLVSGGVFTNNTAYYGGGVYVENSVATLASCALVGNIATLGDGGGAFIKDCSGDVVLSASLVSANSAGGHTGGGVGVMNASFILRGSTINANSAPDGCGGGVGLDAGAEVQVQQGTVVSANSARAGGGLCCSQCDVMFIADSFVWGNVALGGAGGGVYTTLSPTTLVNATLASNTASAGGAVAAVSTSLNITGSSLHDNVATDTHGGALLHDASDDGLATLVVMRSVLANNVCAAAGGAVALLSSASAMFSFVTFTNNSITAAAPTGGALMALNVASLSVANSSFASNFIKVVSELTSLTKLGYVSSVAALGAGCGGALWVGADTPMHADVSGTLFQLNWGSWGGAMYVTGAMNFTLRWSTIIDGHAYGESSEGGGIMTDMNTVALISDTLFDSCEAVRGGAGWHGGSSQVNYTNCVFDENEAKPGDDTRGSALFVGEGASAVYVNTSIFMDNMGEGTCAGTVSQGRSDQNFLSISNSLFDSNNAYVGGALVVAAYTQATQFALSGVTFSRNTAYIGGVLFSEADTWQDLDCAPLPCNTTGLANAARDYGAIFATPAKYINITIPSSVRSGAPLPVSVSLYDGFMQLINDWDTLLVTITTDALLVGSTRTFYASGAAVFSSLSLKGNENTSYTLTFTVNGANLFGNDENERTATATVAVQACQPGERFDFDAMDCACATGWGLVVDDHSCRQCTADEVVPPGGLSCVACPALSAPVAVDQCECIPGYFGTLVGATGACTQCPADTYRSLADPPETCRNCPATSHTFALGATSVADCLCAINTFNDLSGVNNSFSCAAVPEGGWAPQADSRLFALEGYWRPNANSSKFFKCSAGMCLREEPSSDPNVTQVGYACRTGHTGHLCAVCDAGYAFSGMYCRKCAPGQRFEEWSPAAKGGILFVGIFILVVGVTLLFVLPLMPRVEAAIEALMAPAVESMERALGTMTAGTGGPRPSARRSGPRPGTAGGRPMSSAGDRAGRPMSPGGRPMSAGGRGLVRPAEDSPPRARYSKERRSTSMSQGVRRRSMSITVSMQRHSADAHDSDQEESDEPLMVQVQRPSRVRVFFDLIGEPIRIVVSFWQVVSSFSSTMYVPWPSIYYALASTLNVTSLQFLRLPAISCVQPGVSFLTVFNGVTIGTLVFVVFCAVTYFMGQRTALARNDDERRRRFKSRVLQLFVWGLFLVYPQVSSTTLLIFACSPLEDGTEWLMADYRVQCWTPRHKLYAGVGVIWVRARVPRARASRPRRVLTAHVLCLLVQTLRRRFCFPWASRWAPSTR